MKLMHVNRMHASVAYLPEIAIFLCLFKRNTQVLDINFNFECLGGVAYIIQITSLNIKPLSPKFKLFGNNLI